MSERPMHAIPAVRPGAAGERGSAYIVALLALVLLTILGLSLVLITQTEVQIGANERTVSRTFYAADAGLSVAGAQALAAGEYTSPSFTINQENAGVLGNLADVVDVSPMVPLTAVRCNWCPANDDGTPKFYRVTHAVTAEAERLAWSGTGPPPADATVLGQKTLSVMLEFEPWPSPPTEPIADAIALKKVRF
jgi:hypothetical protein